MAIFFEPFAIERCCLCGADGAHTGEHKVMAAALRKIFGNDAMAISTMESGTRCAPRRAKIARVSFQGSASRRLQFQADAACRQGV